MPYASAILLEVPTVPNQFSSVRVGFVVHSHQLPDARLRVALRRRKGGVAQQLLNRAQIGAVVQQMRSKRVPQRMWM